MNKVILTIAVFAAIGFTSCEKCITCDYGTAGLGDQEFCSKDGDERDAFEAGCLLVGGSIK
jgi:hypothetical protein